jgi:hypothetical protein
MKQDYDAIGTLFGSAIDAQTFVEYAQHVDQVDGPVRSCSVAETSSNMGIAYITLQIVRRHPAHALVQLILKKQGNTWKITEYNHFCASDDTTADCTLP